ncbi:MAG: FMN-binding protein [Treponema sp.]|jgi:urocanate reductase|nr:FMN-binding protein [Treponema sp.]
MKCKLFFVLFVIAVICGCVATSSALLEGEYYEGTAQGYRGPITVQVRMNGNDITEIVVLDSVEDRFVGANAIEELADLVVLYNTTDLDVISGATESSRGFLEAVDNAIMKR